MLSHSFVFKLRSPRVSDNRNEQSQLWSSQSSTLSGATILSRLAGPSVQSSRIPEPSRLNEASNVQNSRVSWYLMFHLRYFISPCVLVIALVVLNHAWLQDSKRHRYSAAESGSCCSKYSNFAAKQKETCESFFIFSVKYIN